MYAEITQFFFEVNLYICTYFTYIHTHRCVWITRVRTNPSAHGQLMTTTLMAKQSENGSGLLYSSSYHYKKGGQVRSGQTRSGYEVLEQASTCGGTVFE